MTKLQLLQSIIINTIKITGVKIHNWLLEKNIIYSSFRLSFLFVSTSSTISFDNIFFRIFDIVFLLLPVVFLAPVFTFIIFISKTLIISFILLKNKYVSNYINKIKLEYLSKTIDNLKNELNIRSKNNIKTETIETLLSTKIKQKENLEQKIDFEITIQNTILKYEEDFEITIKKNNVKIEELKNIIKTKRVELKYN